MSKGLRLMLWSTLFFSVMSILVKWCSRTLPHEEVVFARGVVTLLLSGAALWRAGLSVRGNNTRLLLMRGLAGFVGLNCYFYALAHLPLGDATTLHFLNPVLTTVLASVVMGEKARRTDALALGLSLTGVMLVSPPSFLWGGATRLPLLGVLAALGGAVASSVAYVIIRKLGETDHPLVVVFYFPLVAVPASVPGLWGHAVVPSVLEAAALVAVGVVTQAAQVSMTRGLQTERAGAATTVTTLQVVLGYALGALLFGEEIRPAALLGGALVMLGVAVAAYRPRATPAAIT
jgi:drug/metabolite transporter (DMT)-like permease